MNTELCEALDSCNIRLFPLCTEFVKAVDASLLCSREPLSKGGDSLSPEMDLGELDTPSTICKRETYSPEIYHLGRFLLCEPPQILDLCLFGHAINEALELRSIKY